MPDKQETEYSNCEKDVPDQRIPDVKQRLCPNKVSVAGE